MVQFCGAIQNERDREGAGPVAREMHSPRHAAGLRLHWWCQVCISNQSTACCIIQFNINRFQSSVCQSEKKIDSSNYIPIVLMIALIISTIIFRGVGIVNAMEIVSAFSDEQGLEQFREWIYSTKAAVKPTPPPTSDAADDVKKAWLKVKCLVVCAQEFFLSHRLVFVFNICVLFLKLASWDRWSKCYDVWWFLYFLSLHFSPQNMFKYKHRNLRRKWEVSVNFPNHQVIQAYLKPCVDDSEVPFEVWFSTISCRSYVWFSRLFSCIFLCTEIFSFSLSHISGPCQIWWHCAPISASSWSGV